MIQVVYYYLPAAVGTAEVTPCVTAYTIRCQDPHNPQYANIPNRYENCQSEKAQRIPSLTLYVAVTNQDNNTQLHDLNQPQK